MGAIQNSITGALGAVTGAAIAGKHMKDLKAKEEEKSLLDKAKKEEQAKAAKAKEEEQALLDQEQGLLAKKQYHEAGADLTKLSGESKAAGKAVEETSAAYDAAMKKRPGGKGNTKAAIAEKQKKALTEKEAAQRAFDELKDRIESKLAMQARAEKIMKRTGTWGGIR